MRCSACEVVTLSDGERHTCFRGGRRRFSPGREFWREVCGNLPASTLILWRNITGRPRGWRIRLWHSTQCLPRTVFSSTCRAGVRLERPVQLVNILSNLHPLMAVRRVLVVLEEGAGGGNSCMRPYTARDGVQFMDLQTVELFVADGGTPRLLRTRGILARDIAPFRPLPQTRGADSCVTVDGITLFNGESRNEYFCDFEGEGASLRLLWNEYRR